MIKFIKSFKKYIIVFVLVLFSKFELFAQGQMPDDFGEFTDPDNLDNGAPIDDYVWVLLIMIVLYAFFKINKYKKAN